MEKARSRRADLMNRFLLSRALKIANFIPGIGDITLAVSTVRGIEGKRKLSPGERFNYAATIGMSALAFISLHQGNVKAAAVSESLSYALLHIDAIPVLLKQAAKALEQKSPKLSHLMDTSANYVNEQREEITELARSLSDNSIISLNLNESPV